MDSAGMTMGSLKALVVLGHADVVDARGQRLRGDFSVELGGFGEVAAHGLVEPGGAGEDAGDLADAVGAVVEVDDNVFSRG